VLAGGRIAGEASVAALRDVAGSVRIQVGPLSLELRRQLESLGAGVRAETQSVRISQNTPALQAVVLRTLLDAGVAVIAVEPQESPLERLYLQAVRGELTPAQPGLPRPPAWVVPPPAPAPTPPPRRGEGDTLLNELLGHNDDHEAGGRRREAE
jgi:ABC-2 type transport system ATP-binding protein